jgi:hypothetical protein
MMSGIVTPEQEPVPLDVGVLGLAGETMIYSQCQTPLVVHKNFRLDCRLNVSR